VAISRLLRSLCFLAMTSNLRFLAKNSNARFTKFPRIGGGSGFGFLAKIPEVLRKLFFQIFKVRAQIESVPTMAGRFVGTVLTVQTIMHRLNLCLR